MEEIENEEKRIALYMLTVMIATTIFVVVTPVLVTGYWGYLGIHGACVSCIIRCASKGEAKIPAVSGIIAGQLIGIVITMAIPKL